jgi:hypothetical protein
MVNRVLDVILKVALSLVLFLPVLGIVGVFPEPTRDLYNTDAAFAFIEALYFASYFLYIMAAVHVVAILALWTGREALAAILILPITVNILGFHLFLDGFFTANAIGGIVFFLLNVYFIWVNRKSYVGLLEGRR